MLREKTAEVLLRAAPRVVTLISRDLTRDAGGVEAEEDWESYYQHLIDEANQAEG